MANAVVPVRAARIPDARIFRGRRVRYLPPFRLYLVISVLFFLIVGLPDAASRSCSTTNPDADSEEMDAVAKKLEQVTAPASDALKQAAEAVRSRRERTAPRRIPTTARSRQKGLAKRERVDRILQGVRAAPIPRAQQELRTGCTRPAPKVAEDGGAELFKAFVHNIPKAMFVFLPLLAAGHEAAVLAAEALLRRAPAVPHPQPRLRIPGAGHHGRAGS